MNEPEGKYKHPYEAIATAPITYVHIYMHTYIYTYIHNYIQNIYTGLGCMHVVCV